MADILSLQTARNKKSGLYSTISDRYTSAMQESIEELLISSRMIREMSSNPDEETEIKINQKFIETKESVLRILDLIEHNQNIDCAKIAQKIIKEMLELKETLTKFSQENGTTFVLECFLLSRFVTETYGQYSKILDDSQFLAIDKTIEEYFKGRAKNV